MALPGIEESSYLALIRELFRTVYFQGSPHLHSEAIATPPTDAAAAGTNSPSTLAATAAQGLTDAVEEMH